MAARQASLSITNSRSSPKFMCIEPVMPSSHLILCRPLLLLPPIPPSIRVFSNESALPIRWPKCWNFSFNISLSNEYSGLISFRIYMDIYMDKRTQIKLPYLSSVQFSHSVVSDSLRPHESQHVRPPCSSPSPRVHSDSHPSSPWCHPAISSSVIPFSSCPQSLPASGFFPIRQLFSWGGQSTGASALASFLPKKSQGWSP